jgi:cytolysin-activating lysine-acyltransferase
VNKAIPSAPRTVAEALGQITWLFSQSALHRHLKIADLEWSVMPAILHEQFRVFTFGPLLGLEDMRPEDLAPGFTREGLENMPLGVALWGWLSVGAEAKVEAGERLDHGEWKSGDRLWLLELITPFGTPENKLGELMFADLLQGPFANQRLSLHRTDPASGRKDKITLGGDAATD